MEGNLIRIVVVEFILFIVVLHVIFVYVVKINIMTIKNEIIVCMVVIVVRMALNTLLRNLIFLVYF